MSPHGHLVWWAITAACLVWYGTITVAVAWRGLWDIGAMLKRLRESGGGGEAR